MDDLKLKFAPVTDSPGVAVAAPGGPLDGKGIALLQSLFESPRGSKIRSWVLDVSRVRYIHSYGMSYLVTVRDRLAESGGSLVLANAPPKLRVLFEMMGLSELIPLYRSVTSALASLGASRGGKSAKKQSSLG